MSNFLNSSRKKKDALKNLWSAIVTLDPGNDKTDAKIVQKIR